MIEATTQKDKMYERHLMGRLVDAIESGYVFKEGEELTTGPTDLDGKPEGIRIQFVDGTVFKIMVVKQ